MTTATPEKASESKPVNAQGVFLTGEFISVYAKRSYQDREGNTRTPYAVKLLVGNSVLDIEYDDEQLAGAAIKGAMKGDSVTLSVFAQGAWNNETRRREPVFFRGRER